MKKPLIICLLFSTTCLLTVSAQTTVTTDPVGFFTVDVNANTDGRVALGLTRTPALTTTVASVSGNQVSLNATLVADQFVYVNGVQDDRFYLFVKNNTQEGEWFQITDNDTSSVTVVPGASGQDIQTEGLQAGDSVCVIPFWTLQTLFPDGEGAGVNSNLFAPTNFVLLDSGTLNGTNLAHDQVFFYFDGTGNILPAGWYDNTNPFGGTKEDTPVRPDSYLILRNPGAAKTITVSGAVPTSSVTTEIVAKTSPQDNLVSSPFPVPVSLAQSKLLESGAVVASPNLFSPGDKVLLYDSTQSGTNIFPSKVYFYHDGSSNILPAGWYDNTNPFAGSVDNDPLIQPGDAITIRKAGVGSEVVVEWKADTPYVLD